MSDNESEEEICDLSNSAVTTKYRTAGDIVQKTLELVVAGCVADADICSLCELGDKTMEEETGKLYNKKVKGKKVEKGIAFPTCISVNDLAGHFSPFKNESKTLKAGDVVKVDMACHIDGYIAAAGHTVVVDEEKVEDRRADVIMAAWNAAEAAIRLIQVGKTNTQITETFAKVAEEFNCKPLQGVLSHQLKRHVIDGSRAILGAETADDHVDEFEFELNEVYCVDVVMSTGEGKARESELRTTVFKRAVDASYNLKTQKARQFISEVNKRFPALPFCLRAIGDEQVARIGVSESKRHELLEEYPVVKEKDGQYIAQFKFTVLILPGGTKKITGLPLGAAEKQLNSTLSVKDEELKALLATSAKPKKNKKKAVKEEA